MAESDGGETPTRFFGGQTPARDILETQIEEGLHEIHRELDGLFLSGLSAGLDIGFGPLLMAVILTLSAGSYGDLPTELLLASAYSIGFIFVVLGRSELFTEHTTLAVLPVIDGRASLRDLGRLWSVIFVSNVIGGLVFALFVVNVIPTIGVVRPESFVTVAEKLIDHGAWGMFLSAVLAGWLMGLLSWLVTAAQSTMGRLLIIWLITAAIGLLHLPHSIAGNVEVLFGLFLAPEITLADYGRFLVLATLGNVVGGSVFVALLKYGHISRG
ncbi:formate transporter [Haloprofundus marisrubri]|uniref:Formate transporter n=1 Tax=Haloprofundus marisrubri TaxID=1514971 RepID=A0A0W1R6X8_9EURY|nr:formate/nitrite transporter family protein [Haloprofundus marisrubri]KTG09187.1 formate transporter [Haloprofundus marisrubri]